jgi:hypothetical protein
VSQLDASWAIDQINRFLHATDQVAYNNDPSSGVVVFGTHQRGSEDEAAGLAYVVEKILDAALPYWPKDSGAGSNKKGKGKWDHLREWASRCKAQLERDEELREKLGDNAPQLDAGKLHPWVWSAAKSLWRTGHYRNAITQVAIQINAEAQTKLARRDLAETKLFQNAFSADSPKVGMPRLRLMADDGSDTFKSVHRGASALAEGLYASFRNPSSHTVQNELPEQEALEQLAAFSALARIVDRATVETAP